MAEVFSGCVVLAAKKLTADALRATVVEAKVCFIDYFPTGRSGHRRSLGSCYEFQKRSRYRLRQRYEVANRIVAAEWRASAKGLSPPEKLALKSGKKVAKGAKKFPRTN